ncbi:MAG: exosortase C-terminal domain/associated protein EpsI [Steroidobacteraceae bacterium]
MTEPDSFDGAPRRRDRNRAIPAYWVPLILLAASVVCYWPDLRVLAARWQVNPEYSHGWLVAALVPIFVWLRRGQLAPAVGAEGGRGLAALGLLVCATGYAMAHAAGVNVAAFIAMLGAVFMGCWLVLGWPAARALMVPIGFFIFAVPVWAVLKPVLQWVTIKVSTFLIALFGVKATVQGAFVTLKAGTFQIAGGCGGLNFFLAALTIAAAFAFVERLRPPAARRVTAVAIGLALVANWVRVAAVIVIGDITDMRSSLVNDHYAFGWWVFAVAFLPFFLFGRRIAARDAAPAVRPTVAPRVRFDALRACAALIAVAAGPAWVWALDARAGGKQTVVLPTLSGWAGPATSEPDWLPAFPGAAAQERAAYSRANATVDVLVARYDRQESEDKLLGNRSTITGQGWTAVGDQVTTVPASGASGLVDRVIEEEATSEAGRSRLFWYWYEVRGTRVRKPFPLTLALALGAFGLSRDSGVIALSARCEPSCDAARRALSDAYAAGLGRIATTRQ